MHCVIGHFSNKPGLKTSICLYLTKKNVYLTRICLYLIIICLYLTSCQALFTDKLSIFKNVIYLLISITSNEDKFLWFGFSRENLHDVL